MVGKGGKTSGDVKQFKSSAVARVRVAFSGIGCPGGCVSTVQPLRLLR